MISKTWSRKPIAALVAVAILSVYSMVVLASPAAKAPSGELSIAGQVTVNGETAVSGGTVFSESIITTAEKTTYGKSYTYDILPVGASGLYWANGILIGSTLK